MGKVTEHELRMAKAKAMLKYGTEEFVIEQLTMRAQGTFDKAADQAKAQAKAQVTAAKGTTLVLARDWPKRVYPLRMNRRRK